MRACGCVCVCVCVCVRTYVRHEDFVVQLLAPGQLLLVVCDSAPGGEDAEELDWQLQGPAPLPAWVHHYHKSWS